MAKIAKKRTTRPRQRKMRVPRRQLRGVPERASCTTLDSFTYNANQVYQSYNVTLLGQSRASLIAQGYQLFRIKKVTFRLKSQADTFVPNSNSQVPYLYFMIDRTAALSKVSTADQLRQLGAKARRVDDKIIEWSYRPSVLNASLDGEPSLTATWHQYKISPWLSCDMNAFSTLSWSPSEVNHLGCVWVVDQVNNSGSVTYVLEKEYEFEFCKPALPAIPAIELPPLPDFRSTDPAFPGDEEIVSKPPPDMIVG